MDVEGVECGEGEGGEVVIDYAPLIEKNIKDE